MNDNLEEIKQNIKEGNLVSIYSSLSDIVENKPELAKDVFDTFMEAIKSDKNNGDSLYKAYFSLSNIVRNKPELAENVFDTFMEAIKSDKNTSDSLIKAYSSLSDIVEKQPELAKDVFDTFMEAIKSDKNSGLSLKEAYSSLSDIVRNKPELAKDVFDTFMEAIKSDKNSYGSLYKAYSSLSNIVRNKPELAENVLDILKEAIKSDKNNGDSLCGAYYSLNNIVEKQPELAKDVFDTFMEAIKSDKNTSDSLERAYSSLRDIVEEQPELAKDVFDTFMEAIKSDKNTSDSLIEAYYPLRDIVINKPELAKDVFDTFMEAIKSDKNSGDSLSGAYSSLRNIVEMQPELAENVFDIVKEAIKSDKNSGSGLGEAYYLLNDIVKRQPELAENVLDTFMEAIKSDKNSNVSLRSAYSSLSDIVINKPELAKDVFDTFMEAIKSDKNSGYSLVGAYSSLNNIVEKQPELAENVFDIVKKVLLYQNDISIEGIIVTARCLKNCKDKDFDNENRLLTISKKLMYSTQEEIAYFYENHLEQCVEYDLSQQQSCMHDLMEKLVEENNLDKNQLNDYRKNQQNKTYTDNAAWLVPASFKGSDIFGSWFPFPDYIRQATQHLNLHDSVYWLPKDMGKEKNESFASFVKQNLVYVDHHGKKHVRELNEMEIIAKNWRYLKPEEEKQKFKDILAVCKSRKYDDQEYADFAVEAAKWGTEESCYKDYESIYKAGLKVPEPFDSSKEFKFGSYTGRFLPRKDVRVGFFGGHTDCCQHFEGVGRTCAISSIKDPFSQLFVIENQNGDIVAGSWVWENKEGTHRDVCFDNIEALNEYKKRPLINQIYEQACRYLVDELNCRKVTIGMGHQDANTSSYEEVSEGIALPSQYKNGYSDAKGTQVLLAENKDAQPLDKTQESKRFIRDVCYLDYEALDVISKKCFPDSDARIQKAGDRLTGLALVDEDKGIVGYCLYNEEKRYISDMAVLPEYRKDKNASSKKLLAEMIRRVNEIGGKWSAELREGTSLRYMQAMQERGIVDMQVGEVDHVMSDGSKVYSVSFTPKGQRSKQQNKHMINTVSKRDPRS